MANAKMGETKIVRIWVFTALQGIQLDLSKTHTLGLTQDMKDNLQTVFTLAKKYPGLKVYVTALNGARGWIQNMTKYVKSKTTIAPETTSWLPVTSSGWGSAVQEITLGLFSGLGLDFYDIHVYANWGQYSGVTALCNKVSVDGFRSSWASMAKTPTPMTIPSSTGRRIVF
jgi:hypothetical protein